MTTNKNIKRIENSIKLQQKMLTTYRSFSIACPNNIELAERIIKSLEAQLSLLK